ncbi:hypothetical protein D3C72_2202780 [compost metagenome]
MIKVMSPVTNVTVTIAPCLITGGILNIWAVSTVPGARSLTASAPAKESRLVSGTL